MKEILLPGIILAMIIVFVAAIVCGLVLLPYSVGVTP
jgi:hypothetical protein